MKEFSAQTGGRYTYVDDVINLQDLALAFASVFDGCENFIISGCEASGTSISPGYVYINGKIRHFSGASNISLPQYIYERNTAENISYANGTSKVGRNVYGCSIAPSPPVTADDLTGEAPMYITVGSNGGLRIGDALFGRYALLLQSVSGQQTVGGAVTFQGNVTVNNALSANGGVSVTQSNCTGSMRYSGQDLVVRSQVGNNIYEFKITEDEGFLFYVNGSLIYTISDYSAGGDLTLFGSDLDLDTIAIQGTDIVNKNHAGDDGVVRINMRGHGSDTEFFRDTVIGNGKNRQILFIDGSEATAKLNGRFFVNSVLSYPITLLTNESKNDVCQNSAIRWVDTTDSTIAHVGYVSNENNSFEIKNTIDDVFIEGKNAVDIGPLIKENGEPLSSKYVTVTAFNDYTYDLEDNVIPDSITGYCGDHCVSKSQLLADIAVDEISKNLICQNIGAARANQDYQPLLGDTGWIEEGYLNFRQIGDIVSIRGELEEPYNSVFFTLPEGIEAPESSVYTHLTDENGQPFVLEIAPDGKAYGQYYVSGGIATRIYFSTTYIV